MTTSRSLSLLRIFGLDFVVYHGYLRKSAWSECYFVVLLLSTFYSGVMVTVYARETEISNLNLCDVSKYVL